MALQRRIVKASGRWYPRLAWLGFSVTALLLVYALCVSYGALAAEASDVQVTGSQREEWQRAAAGSFLELRGSLHNIAIALVGALWVASLYTSKPRLSIPIWLTFGSATAGLVGSIYLYYRFSTQFLDSQFFGAFSPSSAIATAAWEAQSWLLIVGAVGTATVLLLSAVDHP